MATKHRIALMPGLTYEFWFVRTESVTEVAIFLVLMFAAFIFFVMMED